MSERLTSGSLGIRVLRWAKKSGSENISLKDSLGDTLLTDSDEKLKKEGGKQKEDNASYEECMLSPVVPSDSFSGRFCDESLDRLHQTHHTKERRQWSLAKRRQRAM